jgi:hypothetical protein
MEMASKVRFLIDESLTLRPLTTAADTASTAGGLTVFTSETLNKAYWDNGEASVGRLSVGVVIKSVDRAQLDETYKVAVELTDSVGGNPTEIAVSPSVTAPGSFLLSVDGSVIDAIPAANRAAIRVKSVITGTSPSMVYGAWIVGGSMHNYS